MRNILKMIFILGIILTIFGVAFFFLVDEKIMFSYLTVYSVGIICIGIALLMHSKDLKGSNPDKSEKIKSFVWIWILAAVFVFPIAMAAIKALIYALLIMANKGI